MDDKGKWSAKVVVFFFFQAEDGIRDHCVTGVQTCALPISSHIRTQKSYYALLCYRVFLEKKDLCTSLAEKLSDRKSVV